MLKDSTNVGAFVLGALGVLLTVLKLTGTISWPWWLVTAPFWSPVAAILLIWLILLMNTKK